MLPDPTQDIPDDALIDAAWRRGRLKYKLKPCQWPIYDAIWAHLTGKSTIDTYVLLISRQQGKSYTMVLVSLECGIRYPGHQIKFAIPFSNRFDEMYDVSLTNILADKPGDMDIKVGHQVIEFWNGSNIVFGGVDLHPDRLRGAAAHEIFMDEVGFMREPRKIYMSVLFPQFKTTGGRAVFASTPPETEDHDFADWVREHREIGQILERNILDDDLTTEQIDKIAANYGGRDSTEFRREFLCQFVTESSMALFPQWTAEIERLPFFKFHNLVRKIEPDRYFPFYHRYVSLDFGYADKTAILFAYYDYLRAKLCVQREFCVSVKEDPSFTTRRIGEKIKEIQREIWPGLKVERYIADSASPGLINDLSTDCGLPFVGVTKTKLLNVGEGKVEEGMMNTAGVFIADARLEVDTSCLQTAGCLQHGVWAKGKRGKLFGHSKVYGHYDAAAAVVYLIKELDTFTNPIPPSLDAYPSSHEMRNRPDPAEANVWNGLIRGRRNG